MSKSIRRFLAVAVALVLALILAGIADFTVSYANDPGQDVSGGDPGQDVSGGNPSATDATLAFDGRPSRNGNVVSVTVGTKTVTITVSGTNSYSGFEWNGTTLKYHSSRKGDIQFALGGDFDASTMSVSLIGPNNYHQDFASSATVSMSPGWNLPDDVHFSISETSGQGGGNTLPAGQYQWQAECSTGTSGTLVVQFLDQNNSLLGTTLNCTASAGNTANGSGSIPAGAKYIRFSVSDVQDLSYLQNIQVFVNTHGQNGSVTQWEDGGANNVFDSLRVRDQSNNYQILHHTLPKEIDPATDSVEVRVIFSNTRSVSWSYDASAPIDQYVENCRLYLLNGSDPNSRRAGTDFQLTIGQDYYFLLVPDYGYQVASLRVNGWIEIIPQDAATGVFKFTMVDSNFHFRGVVASATDQTDTSGSATVSNVSIGNGANAAADGGNLKVTITDEAQTTDVSSVTEGTAISTVDIDIDNIVSKGNGDYWSSDVTNFTNPINVTLGLDSSRASAGTYVVIREHNGVMEEIRATYDVATNSITFPSNQFSRYTIVKISDEVTDPQGSSSSSSDSGSSESGSGSSDADSSDPNVITKDADGYVTSVPEAIVAETTLPAEEVKALGVTFAPVITASTETIYSVYNPYTGEIVYTPDAAEKNALVSSGWTDQGILWDTSKDPTVAAPVYRLYNPVTGEHFYTINQSEVIACAKMGFTFEGSAFHVPLKGKLIPVYRMFCSKVAAGAHRFVEDETEVARLEATGNWVKEGVAWYTIAK